MEVNESTPPPPSPWMPDQDQVRLAVLGKLLEELGEAVSAASRCIIQGYAECDPESGKPNLRWLAEEIADVQAMSDLAIEHFELDEEFMLIRSHAKIRHKMEWHRIIRELRESTK